MKGEVREKDVVVHMVMGLIKNRYPSLHEVEDRQRELVATGVTVPPRRKTDINVFKKSDYERQALKDAVQRFQKDMRALHPGIPKKDYGKLKYLSIHVRTDD